jgi:hypothetical protein
MLPLLLCRLTPSGSIQYGVPCIRILSGLADNNVATTTQALIIDWQNYKVGTIWGFQGLAQHHRGIKHSSAVAAQELIPLWLNS